MTDEPLRPGQLASRQDEAMAHYLRHEVIPFSSHHSRIQSRVGPVTSIADMRKRPLVTLEELGTGAELVLEPRSGAERHLPLGERARLQLASVTGDASQHAAAYFQPRYKPVLWTRSGELQVGWTTLDLDRLGELGRRLLERAGVRPADRFLSVHGDPSDVGFWELALGARTAGVATLHLPAVPEPSAVVDANPTVIAGAPAEVLATIGAAGVVPRIVILTGRDRPMADAIANVAPDAIVTSAWAPPGVRSLWSEHDGGPGFVTEPEADVVEVVDDDGRPVADGAVGRVVWSALGWRGTVVLRLDTGLRGHLEPAVSGHGGIAVCVVPEGRRPTAPRPARKRAPRQPPAKRTTATKTPAKRAMRTTPSPKRRAAPS